MSLDITIAIPVKNEEANIQNCLDSIGKDFAQKVILIDSGSTDNTVKIAKENGVEIIDFVWDGRFPKKRNWFLRNHQPKTKWVLFLDADEFLTVDFKNEIKIALAKDDSVGYWLNYSIYFLGKKLKGGYPLKKLAMFKVGFGEYEIIEENKWSRFDMEIHEHPIINGPIGHIHSKINHNDHKGIFDYISKHNEYSTWEANRFIELKSKSDYKLNLTWKQKLKYKFLESPLIGPYFFLVSFIFMGGFKDGARGFLFAIFKMSYFTQVYCKIKELNTKD
jgi:glycosyltransferase involved in cell wall biosynthesis